MATAQVTDSSGGSIKRSSPRANLRIRGWTVQPQELLLGKDGSTIRIEPKVMEVLLCLAERPREAVTRHELAERVWPGVIVGDEALSNAINKLRRAFSDDTRTPRFIETVPKVGYRLIAPVERVVGKPVGASAQDGDTSGSYPATEPNAAERPLGAAGAEPNRRSPQARGRWVVPAVLALLVSGAGLWWYAESYHSGSATDKRLELPLTDKPYIAVMPFEDLGEDARQTYFSEGITRDLITDLSRFSGLHVISPSSAFAFRDHAGTASDIARHLHVDYVLQGSIQREGQQLRVNAQLVDVHKGYHLWAVRLDGPLTKLFALQDQIAGSVVEALSLRLTDNEKMTPARRGMGSAVESYWQGLQIYGRPTKQHNDLVRRMYRRAIHLDPRYAPAYAGLALTYIDDYRSGWGDSPENAIDEALRHAHKAVAIDESLPQAHFVLGWVYLYVKGMHERAIAEARKALALNPSYADGYTLLASAYFYLGEVDKALPLEMQAIRLNPAASSLYHTHLGRAYYFQGRYHEALAELEAAVAQNYDFLSAHLWLAMVYARLDRDDDAAWEVDQVLTLKPEFSIGYWVKTRPYRHPDQRQKFEEGLRLAGLPD